MTSFQSMDLSFLTRFVRSTTKPCRSPSQLDAASTTSYEPPAVTMSVSTLVYSWPNGAVVSSTVTPVFFLNSPAAAATALAIGGPVWVNTRTTSLDPLPVFAHAPRRGAETPAVAAAAAPFRSVRRSSPSPDISRDHHPRVLITG